MANEDRELGLQGHQKADGCFRAGVQIDQMGNVEFAQFF